MAVTCTVTVNYDANGGSGAPGRQIVTSQNVTSFPKTFTITLRSGEPTRSGYNFLGWSTSSSASSATYQPGETLTYTFPTSTGGNQSATVNLYAVWSANTYTIKYKPGVSGTGSTQTQTKTHGVSITLKGAIFTRTGYSQVGWSTSDGGTLTYALSASYTANSPITLYPVWEGQNSTISSLSSSVPIDGSTTGTLTLTRKNSSYLHRVEFTFGSYSQVYQNVGETLSFTIPTSWLPGLPNATSGTATCTVKTFSGSTLIGTSVSKTLTITVPSSVKPSVSLSGTNQSSNTTVNGWGILLQGYSAIALSVTASAGTGASITNITFSGDGVNQSGTGTSVTSSVLTTTGSRTWSVNVTDSRGRSTKVNLTRTVYSYNKPSISSFTAVRALQDGTVDEAAGTYIKARGIYSIASCNGNNSVTVKTIEYKLHTDSTWSTGQSSASSNTYYTFGGGNISIINNYDVKITVTDALGNSRTYLLIVSSVKGVSFGLNGECARFGGPVQYDDRFECDWDTVIHGDLTVDGSINGIGTRTTNEPTEASISSGSWTSSASVTLSAGTYVLLFGAVFAQNATGTRQVRLSSTQNSSTAQVRGSGSGTNALSGFPTYVSAGTILTLTANDTFYANCYQNSGSSLNVASWIRAIRIK